MAVEFNSATAMLKQYSIAIIAPLHKTTLIQNILDEKKTLMSSEVAYIWTKENAVSKNGENFKGNLS